MHPAVIIEGDRKGSVQTKFRASLKQGLQAAKENSFGRTLGSFDAFGVSDWRLGSPDEQLAQGCINTVANQASHNGGVVVPPRGVHGNGILRGPAGQGTRREQNRVPNGLVPPTSSFRHPTEHRYITDSRNLVVTLRQERRVARRGLAGWLSLCTCHLNLMGGSSPVECPRGQGDVRGGSAPGAGSPAAGPEPRRSSSSNFCK